MGTPTGLGHPIARHAVPLPAELLLERDAAAHALDCMGRGFMVADHACHLLFSNRVAKTILEAKDGLLLGADGLRAARARDSADLRGLIRYAASPEAAPGAFTVLTIWRPSLKRMLLMRITPIQVPSSPLLAQFLALAGIFVHDPTAPALIDRTALSRLYGLTRAECHLLTLLLNGHTLQDAATTLRVSFNTARTHLKHIFMKTDTNRQTQLISLLLASVMGAAEQLC